MRACVWLACLLSQWSKLAMRLHVLMVATGFLRHATCICMHWLRAVGARSSMRNWITLLANGQCTVQQTCKHTHINCMAMSLQGQMLCASNGLLPVLLRLLRSFTAAQVCCLACRGYVVQVRDVEHCAGAALHRSLPLRFSPRAHAAMPLWHLHDWRSRL